MTTSKTREPVTGVIQIGSYKIEYLEDAEGKLQPLTDAPLSSSETLELGMALVSMTDDVNKSRAGK